MRVWQKTYVSGSSTVVTLPRPLMYALGLVPGDLVSFEIVPGEQCARFEKLEIQYKSHRSPGVMPDDPPAVKP